MLRKRLCASAFAGAFLIASAVDAQNIGTTGTDGAHTMCTRKPGAVDITCVAPADSGGGDPTDTTYHAIRVVRNYSNPTLNSVLTLGAAAPYGVSTTLCASSCTPSSIYVTLPNGNMAISGGVIRVNDALANSWGINSQITVDLFSAAPTLSNGDGGAYKIASGTAFYLGSLSCTNNLGVQVGDGSVFKCNVVGSVLEVALGAANAKLYATFYTPTGSGTPTAGSTLNLTLTGSN